MPVKRKYARSGEAYSRYECTKRKCKWQGDDSEKSQKQLNGHMSELVCPKCGNNEFYMLLDTNPIF